VIGGTSRAPRAGARHAGARVRACRSHGGRFHRRRRRNLNL